MAHHPTVDELQKIFEDHPALVDALERADYWRSEDGGIAFRVETPNDEEVIAGFQAMADLFEMPLDHLPAHAPPTPTPHGSPMTFAELAERRPLG